MNKYEILSHLVTVVAIIAIVVMAYCVRVLAQCLSTQSVHAWLDRESDTFADYMEDEQERRTAMYHGDPDAKSLRRWYGLSYLVERRLFRLQYDAACALNKRQLGMRTERGEADGGLLLVVLVVLLAIVGGCQSLRSSEDVQRETTCIDNGQFINSVGGDVDLNDC